MSRKSYPQEEGIWLRYLHELNRMRILHNLTAKQFVSRLGFKSSASISDLSKSRNKVNLKYLMATHNAFPEFRLMWVLTDSSMPEVDIINLQGLKSNGNAGRKPNGRPAKRKPVTDGGNL